MHRRVVDCTVRPTYRSGVALRFSMGGIKKKKAKRGIEHHKRSLEETLEAPETYGVRVSGTHLRFRLLLSSRNFEFTSFRTFATVQSKTRPAKDGEQQRQQQQMKLQKMKRQASSTPATECLLNALKYAENTVETCVTGSV